jgi:hypothetical protein
VSVCLPEQDTHRLFVFEINNRNKEKKEI